MGLLVLLHAMYLSNLLDGNLTVTSHPPPTLTKGLLEPRRTEYPENASVSYSKHNRPQRRKPLSLLAWAIAT